MAIDDLLDLSPDELARAMADAGWADGARFDPANRAWLFGHVRAAS